MYVKVYRYVISISLVIDQIACINEWKLSVTPTMRVLMDRGYSATKAFILWENPSRLWRIMGGAACSAQNSWFRRGYTTIIELNKL